MQLLHLKFQFRVILVKIIFGMGFGTVSQMPRFCMINYWWQYKLHKYSEMGQEFIIQVKHPFYLSLQLPKQTCHINQL